MVDTSYARDARQPDVALYADALDATAWRQLQAQYQVGQWLMPCCAAAAIPKTSSLGLQFFAHASGQCGSSPEGIWHQQAKEAVATAARELGYRAIIEHPSADGWRADVWIDGPGRPAVVELQHSYQHLRDYLRRQARYTAAGMTCLWLVMAQPFGTLSKSTYRMRAKTYADGRIPLTDGTCLELLSAASLQLEPAPTVHGLDLHADLSRTLEAFLHGRLTWSRGRWLIDGQAIPYPRLPSPND